MPKLIHQPSQKVIADPLFISHSLIKRMRGLLASASFPIHAGMWIQPCSQIHTLFMKFAIDVIFVDKHLCVQCLYENVPPYKMLTGFGKVLHPLQWLFHFSTYRFKPYMKINSVFEFHAGHLAKHSIQKGDFLHVDA